MSAKKCIYMTVVWIVIFGMGMAGCASGTNTAPGTTQQTNTATTTGTTGTTDTSGTTGTAVYKDGTYTGEGDPWEFGREDASVTVKGGRIESIVLRRLDKDGKEVDYNTFTGETIEGKTYPNLKKYREDMANEMVSRQTYNVDAISGATVSTENWKIAVQRALDKAK